MANTDVPFLRSYLELMAFRFPLLLKRAFLFEPPWYVKPIISVLLKVFPTGLLRKVSMLDRGTAIEQLGLDGMPEGAGGQLCTQIPVPANAPSAQQFAEEYGIPMQAIARARREYHLTHPHERDS